ncbi:hypothetical protein ACJA88_014951 [Fusarium oxysporum]
MLQSESPPSSESDSRRHARSPSPSCESRSRKRQRQSRQASFSPPILASRPRSASSTGTSVGRYYGAGDGDAVENLFASYPRIFTTAPQPHGSQGLHEPLWELRFDHEIYLSNDFPSRGGRPQRVRIPIPGPETDILPSYFPPQSPQEQSSPARAEFQSALELVQESYERVRQWRERWGWSPLSSDALESPPPYSPPREPSSRPPSPEEIRSSSPRISSSPALDAIPNPPIPGNPFPTVETLLDSVNAFAKANGFGFAKHNGRSYKGRKIRYSLRCDRYGDPRPSRGAGLRQRKSRKCGCKWMVIAEALEEGKWVLRRHSNPEHNQHNHDRSIRPSAHPSHRRLTTPLRATIESMSRRDQERDFSDACTADEVLTAREYMGSGSEYLGDLRAAISSKGLGLINKQYRLARKAMPTGKNPFPKPLGDCNDDCSVSVELGIPCCHKVYSKLGSAASFTRWEVHPRWRLRESSAQDPYRRILDPKIATALRGRPRNIAQVVPVRLTIRSSESQPDGMGSSERRNREQVNKPEARHLSVDAVGRQEARIGRPWRGWKLMQANRPAAKPVPYTGIRHAAGRLFSERGELQEYVLAGGRRNRVFGDKEVNGSCGTATKRFFLQSL